MEEVAHLALKMLWRIQARTLKRKTYVLSSSWFEIEIQKTMWQFFFQKDITASPASPGTSPKNCNVFTMYIFPKIVRLVLLSVRVHAQWVAILCLWLTERICSNAGVVLTNQHWFPIAVSIGKIPLTTGSGTSNCKNGIKEYYILFLLKTAFS